MRRGIAAAVALLAAGLVALPLWGDDTAGLTFRSGADVLVATPEDIVTVSTGRDLSAGPALMLRFRPDFARDFTDLTARIVGSKLTLEICGRVISEPVVQSIIAGGSAMISVPPEMEAERLAEVLRGGDCGVLGAAEGV